MRSIKSIIILAGILLAVCIAPQKASAQEASVSFQVFYDDLSPYGTWVNSPSYGYVWVPGAGAGFVPYETGGHWVYTEFGWTWVSDYAWGWAPFHYGRWYMDPTYGAMWVPGNEWGPAWVTWRRSEGYYGWAPMEPGISISVYEGGGYSIPAERWCFVHDRDFGREDIHNHIVPRTENTVVIHNSTPINNTVVDHNRNQSYLAGPPSTDVQRATGKPVNTIAVHDAAKHTQSQNGSNLEIYRPKMQSTTATGQKPAPPKVAEMKDLKPAAQRNQGQPAKTEPAKAPAKQAEPQRTAPANNVRSQPAPNRAPVTQPSRTSPTNVKQTAPQHSPPMDKQPLRNEPSRQQPMRQAPQQQPMRQAPPQQQPVRQAAPQQQPMREAPQQQPMRQAPPQQQPLRGTPPQERVPVQQPRQEAPRQEAPREQPRQEAPRQEAPREEPRQEAPRSEPQRGPH